MTTTADRHCRATRRDGQPCNAYAGESGFCLAHDPERAAQIAEARRKGGKARHGRKVGKTGGANPATLATMQDVLTLLQQAAGDALQLENSLGRVRALTFVCQTWAKCYETSELERRLSAVEERLDARATHRTS